MKSKVLLLLSCFLLSGCQAQVKQAVLAETKETHASRQELLPQETSSPSTATSTPDSQPVENSVVEESSSIKEEPVASTDNGESSVITEPTESTVGNVPSSESTEATSDLKSDTKPTTEPTAKAVQQVISSPVTAKKVEENYQFSMVKNQTTEEFIQTIGKDAQQIAWDEGLYASVMIAQAILETGSGNSQLARPPHHNLFGIKGSYQGKQVNFNTQEDKGNGELYTINSGFRQYPSYKESLEDYAALLKNGLSGNPGFYQATWKESAATYQDATKALTGKYATDTSYDKKLNALIETYELTSYDQEPNKEIEPELSAETAGSAESQKEIDSPNTESSESGEQKQIITTRTKYPVMRAIPIAQRPANQVSGNRIAE
ncbi:glucosaminidase domain-containing protein [Enterococcus sp. 669A]|uniref:Glucosaminidase domain-containing protein n=1 Tax=Candidatus Enterococcus moelleringii TaxID=2815325 RepID=A0ABS3LHK8_9ENTE|nr:glucosaminidase domain-containing protein [Enterococcus sp. 669A]MBO1307834.1 glucosaminidase domain-containing protein [Enterococcus sp. 669A]